MNQKRRWLLSAVVLAGAALLGSSLRAADDDDHPHDKPTSQPTAHVSLEREMGQMGKAYRIIRKQVNDASQNASTLAAVLDLEQHTLAAKAVAPHSASTLPTAQANAWKLADYQSQMITLLRQELDLEEQLRASKNDDAQKTVAALHGLEEEGHKEFRPRRGT